MNTSEKEHYAMNKTIDAIFEITAKAAELLFPHDACQGADFICNAMINSLGNFTLKLSKDTEKDYKANAEETINNIKEWFDYAINKKLEDMKEKH